VFCSLVLLAVHHRSLSRLEPRPDEKEETKGQVEVGMPVPGQVEVGMPVPELRVEVEEEPVLGRMPPTHSHCRHLRPHHWLNIHHLHRLQKVICMFQNWLLPIWFGSHFFVS
jgi:hypothetical protein